MEIKRFNERVSQIFAANPNAKIIEYIAILREDNQKLKFNNYLVKKERIVLFLDRFKGPSQATPIAPEAVKAIDYLIIE